MAWQDFLSHWPAYIRMPVSAGIVERAASIAWQHGLRAYDSLHLASALAWKDITGDQVVFACYDRDLLKAARQEGFQVWPNGADFDPATLHDWPKYADEIQRMARQWAMAQAKAP